MYRARFIPQVTIPAGFAKWRGPREEPTIKQWVNNNYPRPAGVSAIAWVQQHFPKKPAETDTAWLERLAAEPIWPHLLTQWPVLQCKITNVRRSFADRITADIVNADELDAHYELLGDFLTQRQWSLASMGWVPERTRDTGGRYIKVYRARNAAHGLFQALGIRSMLCQALPGEVFHYVNTVLPSVEARRASQVTHDIHNPGWVGPWNLFITSTKNENPPGLAVACYHLDREPLTGTMTDDTVRRFKWQCYQAVLYADTCDRGLALLRSWMSPEKMVLLGAPPESTDEHLYDYGFQRGYPRHFLQDGKRTVPCRGYQQDHRFVDGDPVRYYYVPFPEANDPLELLRKLDGFDAGRIAPA